MSARVLITNNAGDSIGVAGPVPDLAVDVVGLMNVNGVYLVKTTANDQR